MGVRPSPLRYTITAGGEITSDVLVSGFGQRAWLSAGGRVLADDSRDPEDTCRVAFERFWVSFGDAPASYDDVDGPVTQGINAFGKLFFFEDLSVFPVRFWDEASGLCAFDFPPLNGTVAAYRIRDA